MKNRKLQTRLLDEIKEEKMKENENYWGVFDFKESDTFRPTIKKEYIKIILMVKQ